MPRGRMLTDVCDSQMIPEFKGQLGTHRYRQAEQRALESNEEVIVYLPSRKTSWQRE